MSEIVDKIKLKGLNQRGKNRVAEHGPIFVLIRGPEKTHWGPETIFVKPSKKSDNWYGWLELGVEVELVCRV